MEPEQYHSVEECIARQREVIRELAVIDSRYPADNLPDGERERFAALKVEHDALQKRILELRTRSDTLKRLATMDANTEAYTAPGSYTRSPVAQGQSGPDQSRALTALERTHNLSNRAGTKMESLVRGDQTGLTARLIAAAGDPEYSSAFSKILRDPQGAQHSMSAAESEAVFRVKQIVAERAMGDATGAEGQYLLPISVDPSIQLSSSGAINPVRQLARTLTLSAGFTVREVVSAGVVAQYQTEGAEAVDNSPTLSQPTITPQRCTCFVPLSQELMFDWADAAAQIALLISDAKDVNEANEFTNGVGTTCFPQGILVGLGSGQQTLTGTTSALAVADVYSVRDALEPRWQAAASWLMSPQMGDSVYRLVAQADAVNAKLFDVGRGGPMLGKQVFDLSAMPTTVESGNAVAVYGDLSRAYLVVDRIGMSIQIIPQLFGSANRYPTGQTGFYAFWRNSAAVVVPQAATYLQTK